jgi:hypothetical protein
MGRIAIAEEGGQMVLRKARRRAVRVQHKPGLILHAEHWKGRGSGRNEICVFAQVARGERMGLRDFSSIHVGKSIGEVVVHQRGVVLRGEITERYSIGISP